MTTWIAGNWEWALLGFMVLEKVVRFSPTKADDVIFDMILKPIFKALKGKR